MRWIIAGLMVVAACGVYGVCGAADGEDGVCEVKEPVTLFNGENFDGWELFIPDKNADPDQTWSADDGIVRCKGKPVGYMRTTRQYAQYKLRFDWRWPRGGGNSGCLLHVCGEDAVWPKSIESQLQSEHAGDFWVIGGTDFKEHVNKGDRRVPKQHAHNEKPLGKWNTMEVVCKDNTIQVYVNGMLQNEATETTVNAGYIGLQSEGTPIEFRNIRLEPAPSK